MASALVVKIAVGFDNPERLTTGLSVAGAAAAAGIEVSLWLANDATWLAVSGHAESFPDDARELFTAAAEQARVSVCARCAQRRGITAQDLLPEARIEGAAAFVAAVTAADTQALVY